MVKSINFFSFAPQKERRWRRNTSF